MMGPAPVCLDCKRYHKDSWNPLTCDAFPKGIPAEILVGGDEHKSPVEGDGGLLFERKEEAR